MPSHTLSYHPFTAFHTVSHLLAYSQVSGHWQCRRHTKPRPVARFGYAHSRDLVRWEGVKLVEAPVHDACSLWAPEISVLPPNEGGGLLVVFTVTQASGLCPSTMRESEHRPYYTISRDLRHWSAPKPLEVNGGESIIDMYPLLNAHGGGGEHAGEHSGGGVPFNPPCQTRGSPPCITCCGALTHTKHPSPPIPAGGKHLLFYKAESNLCGPPYEAPLEWRLGSALHTNASCSLVLRVARASKATGPWKLDHSARGAFFSDAISRPCVEGPTVVRGLDGGWVLLFDDYRIDCLLLAPRDDDGACVRIAGRPASAVGLRLAQDEAADRSSDAPCAYEPMRKGFGALRSGDDLATWTDVTGKVRVPAEHKHGSALKLPEKAWRQICEDPARTPFERICFERQHAAGALERALATED